MDLDNLSPKQRKHAMAAVCSTNTTPEMVVRRLLHHAGYRYRLHHGDLPGSPDIVLPRRRVAIFVHGCFWHQHHCSRGSRMPSTNSAYWRTKLQANVRRDQRVRRALNRRGWRVMTVWECQTSPSRCQGLWRRLFAFLGPPTATPPSGPTRTSGSCSGSPGPKRP